MAMRVRKLIATILLLIFLALYAWAAVIIGAGRITLAPHWAQLAYFLIAGLLWVIPAGFSSGGCNGPIQPPKRQSAVDLSERFQARSGPYLRAQALLLKLTEPSFPSVPAP
jgi:hypothetical protein